MVVGLRVRGSHLVQIGDASIILQAKKVGGSGFRLPVWSSMIGSDRDDVAPLRDRGTKFIAGGCIRSRKPGQGSYGAVGFQPVEVRSPSFRLSIGISMVGPNRQQITRLKDRASEIVSGDAIVGSHLVEIGDCAISLHPIEISGPGIRLAIRVGLPSSHCKNVAREGDGHAEMVICSSIVSGHLGQVGGAAIVLHVIKKDGSGICFTAVVVQVGSNRQEITRLRHHCAKTIVFHSLGSDDLGLGDRIAAHRGSGKGEQASKAKVDGGSLPAGEEARGYFYDRA